jgi:L-ascorbate oxidase
MGTDNLTMHWHGIGQYGSPFADGTPYASQWPIPAGKYYDYEFQFDDDLDGTLYSLYCFQANILAGIIHTSAHKV